MDHFVTWQRVEGALVLLSSIALFIHLDIGFSWWLAVLIFFAPDISFIAYLFGSKLGAIGYNLLHVYALGTVSLALGFVFSSVIMSALGALWLAHSGFDRMLGYGRKSPEGFTVTHMGKVGRSSNK